jgi:hypothetical protein
MSRKVTRQDGLSVWQVDDALNLDVDRGQASGSLNRYGVTDSRGLSVEAAVDGCLSQDLHRQRVFGLSAQTSL